MQLAKRELRFYWKLFSSTFTLSAFTFGGGYVIIPLMRKKFVQQYHWLEEDEMLDLTAIAQSSPGPIAVNAAIIIGYRLAGMLGVLPPLIILSVISLFYQAFRANQVVANVLRGMQAGVAAVIVDVTVTMGWGVAKEKNILSILMMVAAFVATYVFNVNVAFIVLACGLIGFLCFRQKKSGEVSK